MLAARNDKEELKKIRERTTLTPEELAARNPDNQSLLRAERRVSDNLIRIFATQVRNAESPEAYAIIPSGDSSLGDDDQRPVSSRLYYKRNQCSRGNS